MTVEFDPYYYFLGIAGKDQAIDHYRLLGLMRFEADPDIISMAADRQMSHLQRHESGDRVEEVSRLLNQVARARLCLLDAEKKAAYDAELKGLTNTADTMPGGSSGPSPSQPENETRRRDVVLHEILDRLASNRTVRSEEFELLWDSLDLNRGIDRHKAEILFEINDAIAAHKAKAPGWQAMFVRGISHHVLCDLKSFGEVDEEEGNWLVEKISGDKQLDANELALLAEIKSRTDGQIDGRLRRLLDRYADRLPSVDPKPGAVDAANAATAPAQPAEAATGSPPPVSASPGMTSPISASAVAAPSVSMPAEDQPARPAVPTSKVMDAEVVQPTCYFCGQRQSSDDCPVTQSMYGEVKRRPQKDGTLRATWENAEVKVPRCHECQKQHRRIHRSMAGGALVGMLTGALSFLSILALGAGGVCVGLTIMALAAAIGAGIGFAVAISENPYDLKVATNVREFAGLRKLQQEGWKRGAKPSQQEQQKAPIERVKSEQPRWLNIQGVGGAASAPSWERTCPNCGQSSYTMRAKGECPRCGYLDVTSSASPRTD